MSSQQIPYPQGPESVPADLVATTTRYRIQIILTLFGILLFWVFYLMLVAGTAYLLYWSFMYDIGRNAGRGEYFLKIASIAVTGMLFIFTLKFLFKPRPAKDPLQVPISPKDHPTLFAFIKRLASETGAPTPKKVFVSPEINASVFYNNPFLSLFLPVRKNLLIGLGLVNSLNLSEFKAVLAHEFGHFSQKSMKLGSYVYVANRIIYDMVFVRDSWDEALKKGTEIDYRLAIPAWFVIGIIALLRTILQLFLKLINIFFSGLSQQMEYNADLVAVSVAGSNSIVNALYKLEISTEAFSQTFGFLENASHHHLYTRDIFFHHQRSLEELTTKNPAPTDEQVFAPDSDHILPAMYASHPSGHLREQNAKRQYIVAAEDQRPAWILFDNAEALRLEISKKTCELQHGPQALQKLCAPEQIEAFIEEEKEETKLPERYAVIYESHSPTKIKTKLPESQKEPVKVADLELMLKTEGPKILSKIKLLDEEARDLQEIADGSKRVKTIPFRGRTFRADQAPALLKKTEPERVSALNEQKAFDQKLYEVHLNMAAAVGGDLLDRFVAAWEFQKRFEQIGEALLDVQKKLLHFIVSVQQMEDGLTESQLAKAENLLADLYLAYDHQFGKAGKLMLPASRYIAEGTTLRAFLADKQYIDPSGNKLESQWINTFASILGAIAPKLQRLHRKHFCALLRLYDEAAEAFLATQTGQPA